jgi:hypothetical protein
VRTNIWITRCDRLKLELETVAIDAVGSHDPLVSRSDQYITYKRSAKSAPKGGIE